MLPEIETIFATLSDARDLRSVRAGKRTPLADLLRAYSDMTIDRPEMPLITQEWTGADLKKVIAALSDEDQQALLNGMVDRSKIVNAWEYTEAPDVRENRQQKHWIIRFCVVVTSIWMSAIVAIFAISIYRNGIGANGALIQSIINSIIEIMKLVFGSQAT